MKSVATYLMFSGPQHGKAEEAVNFYTSVFGAVEIVSMERYAPGEDGPEGTLKLARLTLMGTRLMVLDSAIPHDFSLNPSMSLFVECDSEAELDGAFERLADGGKPLMPVGDYGFSKRFGWVEDRYGVSWQLNLA